MTSTEKNGGCGWDDNFGDFANEKRRLNLARLQLNRLAEQAYDEQGKLCSVSICELNCTINGFSKTLPDLCEEILLAEKEHSSQ